MKRAEISKIKTPAFRARIKARVNLPNTPTYILGFDTEYISSEGAENEPLSYQLHDGNYGHFIPLDGKLKLSDLTRALYELHKTHAPQAEHICLCAWYAQAELSVLENDLDAVVLHQGGQNYGLRWTIHFSKRRKIIFTIYDLQALLGGSLAKAAPLVGLEKLEWDHNATTRESLNDSEFRRYALHDALICQKLACALYLEFSVKWGVNPLEMQSRGQLASSIFRHIYLPLDSDNKPTYLMQPHPDVRVMALRAYRGSGDYGGCYERGVFTAPEGKTWAEFDAVGAYPAAAISLGYLPTRKDWRGWSADAFGQDFPAQGIYRAQVTWPKDQARRPLLAIVPDENAPDGERYDYPQQAVDVWSGFELQAAKELGATVRIIEGWYYESGSDALPTFLSHLAHHRAKAQAEGADVLAKMYKSLGNTLIGKLGQNKPQTSYKLAWDEERGAADFRSSTKTYATMGSAFMPEWWVLIIGKARAAMMHAIIERGAVHAQVDAVLICVPEDLEEFECGGLKFRKKGAGRVLKLAQRNQWAFENEAGETLRFAAGGGRDLPELRAVMRRWNGSETLRQSWQDHRLITLAQHAMNPEKPLMTRETSARVYIVPALDLPASGGGRVRV